jgi:hypothetical protein
MGLPNFPENPDFPGLRPMLLSWAKQFAHTEEEQRQLVERTIALAAEDPFSLPHDRIDKALLELMLQIARADIAIDPTLAERLTIPAEFR